MSELTPSELLQKINISYELIVRIERLEEKVMSLEKDIKDTLKLLNRLAEQVQELVSIVKELKGSIIVIQQNTMSPRLSTGGQG